MPYEKKGRGYMAPWAWGVWAVVLPLAVYLRTLCPTIFAGDSGELVAGSYCLGIVHPPGYPLYCLIGRLFSLVPVGSVAFRLNLMSALCAALSSGLIFLTVTSQARRARPARKEGEGCPSAIWIGGPALLAGLLCAFSRTLWSQAVVAEVYALNLFLLLLCVLFLFWWGQRGESRFLFFFAFIFGLSLAHHHTAALTTPAFLLFLLWHRRKLFENWKNLLILWCLFFLGLSVYLYLPLRSMANPPLDWGHPVTLRGTLAHIARTSYGSLSKNPRSWALLGDQVHAFMRLLGGQFGLALLGLGLVGLVALFREAKDRFAFTICLFLMCGLGVVLLLNFLVIPKDLYLVQVFFIPAFAMAALWVGTGTRWLVGRMTALAAPLGFRLCRALGVSLGCAVVLLALVPLIDNFAIDDHSRQFLAADLGGNILATLEPKAVLLTSMDTPTFSLAYARIVEGMRPDVSLQHTGRADIFRNLNPSPGALDPEVRPIYGITFVDLPKTPGWAPYPVGIVYQLRRARVETDENLRIWDRYSLRGIGGDRAQEDFFLRELIRNYATARGNLAQELADEGRFQLALEEAEAALAMDTTFFGAYLSLGNVHFQKGSYERAAVAYERGLRWAPHNVEIINNLALAHLRMGDTQGAIQNYRHSLALMPRLAKTHNDLGLAYKLAGRYVQAAEEYRRAMQLDPGYADPLRNLGVIYAYHLVDFHQAIALWERYLSLRPEELEGDKMRAEIQRMRHLLKTKKDERLKSPGKELGGDEHTR